MPLPNLGSRQENAQLVREALAYARDTAKDELDRIDRLHQRTLRGLWVIVAAVLLLGSVAGFIGYKNLRDVVAAQVQEKVKTQIEEQLKQANVDKIVREILARTTDAKIADLVKKEVGASVGPEVSRQFLLACQLRFVVSLLS